MLLSFILSFFASFILAGFLLKATLIAAKRYRLFPRKRVRDIHQGNVARLGGIALFLSFWAIFFFHPLLVRSPLLWGIFFSSAILFCASLLDDLKEQGWLIQLCFQGVALIPLALAGMTVDFIRNPFGSIIAFPGTWGIMLALLWTLFIINALNWLDGLDGLASGVGLMAIAALFFLSLKPEVNQPPLAIMNAIMGGALVCFFMFNAPPAKIFLGTTGATFLGLFLATESVVAGGKIATIALILGPLLFDALWVIGYRIKKKQLPFRSDLSHLHFNLLDKGMKQTTILALYLTTSFFLGILALFADVKGKLMLFFLIFFLFTLVRFKYTGEARGAERYHNC